MRITLPIAIRSVLYGEMLSVACSICALTRDPLRIRPVCGAIIMGGGDAKYEVDLIEGRHQTDVSDG